jgi:isopentenyldiphosphate isomerase
VFVGKYDGSVVENPDEVLQSKWMTKENLMRELEADGNSYVPWLKLVLNDKRMKKILNKKEEHDKS